MQLQKMVRARNLATVMRASLDRTYFNILYFSKGLFFSL